MLAGNRVTSVGSGTLSGENKKWHKFDILIEVESSGRPSFSSPLHVRAAVSKADTPRQA